ncbi:MAG: hypothetical protein F4X36_12315 [Gammaproteobacteria bacterium]|nr:hypothetical protein [Gammaproteobacteria bacterium]
MSWLTEHLDEVGESYAEHLAKASGFAAVLLIGGVACLVHAFLPFLFTRSASDRVRGLHQAMLGKAHDPARRSAPGGGPPD